MLTLKTLCLVVMSTVEKWKSGGDRMSTLIGNVKLNGAPAVVFSAKVETLRDSRRIFKAAEIAVGRALKVFPGLAQHKVTAITIRPE
jgi:hypothetical protein